MPKSSFLRPKTDAAVLKQAPRAEYNLVERIKTNIYGAKNPVRAALANELKFDPSNPPLDQLVIQQI
jgi:hypothetical protein